MRRSSWEEPENKRVYDAKEVVLIGVDFCANMRMGSERRFHVVGAKPSNGDSCGSTLKDALHREINMRKKYVSMARYCCPKRVILPDIST